jgi:hypothetical protein
MITSQNTLHHTRNFRASSRTNNRIETHLALQPVKTRQRQTSCNHNFSPLWHTLQELNHPILGWSLDGATAVDNYVCFKD